MIEHERQNDDGKDTTKQKEIRKAPLNPVHSELDALRGIQQGDNLIVRVIVIGWHSLVNQDFHWVFCLPAWVPCEWLEEGKKIAVNHAYSYPTTKSRGVIPVGPESLRSPRFPSIKFGRFSQTNYPLIVETGSVSSDLSAWGARSLLFSGTG